MCNLAITLVPFKKGHVHLGIMAGHYIGTRVGKAAEILGGLSLIAIGSIILFEHLGNL